MEKAFLKCLHPTHVEGTHIGTLNKEPGPESENNPKKGNVTRGRRNLRSCPKKLPKFVLSWPFTFSINVNINQYKKYHQSIRNMTKIFLASKIGTLPILQDCPTCSRIYGPNFRIVTEFQKFYQIS